MRTTPNPDGNGNGNGTDRTHPTGRPDPLSELPGIPSPTVKTQPSTVVARYATNWAHVLGKTLSPNAVAPLPRTRITTWTLGLLALLVFVAGTFDLLQHYRVAAPDAFALSVLRAAPVLLCLYRPLPAWWLALGAAATTALSTHPVSPAEPWPWAITSVLSVVTVFVVVALRAPRRLLVALGAVLLATGVALILIRGTNDPSALVPMLFVATLAPITASALRDRGEVRERLVVVEEISQAEHARRTLLEERARIARELHDVVAHHMSVITVQADSAPYRIPDLPAAAVDEFATIATEARRSLTEMRRLLNVLRNDVAADPEHSPQPGLAELPVLIETAHRAGLDAHLSFADTVPSPDRIPVGVQLSAYRLVQESLSNVVRHAPGARVRVALTGDADALRVEVVNSAPPAGPTTTHVEGRGAGQGLVGMRERVAMLAGTLDTGPLPDGGFRVDAMLPLPSADPSADRPATSGAS
ncbi:histidine kinase [Streptomyces sp. SID3343]|uniref:sensor histidine kinase n=1 Tax=Streptomyces sp. SID3343 TaxID=2690260 RepID=UPI00136B8DD1|nr:histidine kinase [Streptomyces sp. SID3343]MYV96715.1 sensor histidine kinase [Streptomyces sp. SID3343]